MSNGALDFAVATGAALQLNRLIKDFPILAREVDKVAVDQLEAAVLATTHGNKKIPLPEMKNTTLSVRVPGPFVEAGVAYCRARYVLTSKPKFLEAELIPMFLNAVFKK